MSLLQKLKKKQQESNITDLISDLSIETEPETEIEIKDLTNDELFAQMDFAREMKSGKQHDLQLQVLQKFQKYKLSKSDVTIENTCIKKSTVLIPTLYQNFISHYYANYKNKGILLYNSIGSGKTLSSILMAIAGLKSGMYKKIVVLLPASLKVNYLDHIHEYKDKFEIMSYNTILIKKKLPDLTNTLVIIDECQNLTNMITNGSTIGIFLYNKLFHSKCKIIAMTATPIINNTYEYVSLFNLLRPSTFIFDVLSWKTTFYNDKYEMVNKKLFYDSINGLVSYYQGANSESEVYPSHTVNIVELPMHTYQNEVYKEARLKEIENNKKPTSKKYVSTANIITGVAISSQIGDFMVKSRQICNFAFPQNKTDASQLNENELLDYLEDYSIKMSTIINSIEKCKGVVMVYSYFVDNCLIILKKALDYRNITSTVWIGGMSDTQRRETLHSFNNPKNHDGSRVKVILVSSAGAEGISLKNVQQVHIMEPYWNEIKIKQIIGRAIRICSHYTLPKELQHVNVYRYIATSTDFAETSDQVVLKVSQKKYQTDLEFDSVVKSSAFDCMLNLDQNIDVSECIEEHFK
jgi:superfamily II DNA or RNA helicase